MQGLHPPCTPPPSTHTHARTHAPSTYTRTPQGAFTTSDALLYVIGSAVGMAGTVAGDALSGRLSQRAFARMLGGMVWVCAALMGASGLGLLGPEAPPAGRG